MTLDPDPLHVEPDPRDRYVWIVRRQAHPVRWGWQRDRRRWALAGFVFVAAFVIGGRVVGWW